MSPLSAVKGNEQGRKNLVYRVAIHNTFIAFPIYSLRSPTSNSRSEPLRYKIFADIAPDFIREHVGKGECQQNCSRRALIPEGTAWAEARQTSSIGRFLFLFKDRFWPYTALPSLSHNLSHTWSAHLFIATRRTTTSPTANRNSCGLSGADSNFGIWCWRVLCYRPSPQPSPARGRGGRACLVGRAPRSGAAWNDVYPPLGPGYLEFGPQPRQPEAPETRPE